MLHYGQFCFELPSPASLCSSQVSHHQAHRVSSRVLMSLSWRGRQWTSPVVGRGRLSPTNQQVFFSPTSLREAGFYFSVFYCKQTTSTHTNFTFMPNFSLLEWKLWPPKSGKVFQTNWPTEWPVELLVAANKQLQASTYCAVVHGPTVYMLL